MVPAHCAHQVCNANDSIKIACDFVSPLKFDELLGLFSASDLKGLPLRMFGLSDNVGECSALTNEFRGENLESVWKDDVLQLQNSMW